VTPKSLLLVAALALGACSSGDGEGGSTPTTARPAGCPVAEQVVEEAVGHDVVVERRPTGRGSCAYTGEGGARVEVALRPIDREGLDALRAEVTEQAGGVEPLPDGLVDGAVDGWVAAAGRAVQVTAAAGGRVAIVAVVDPALDEAAAQEVAGELAGEALSA